MKKFRKLKITLAFILIIIVLLTSLLIVFGRPIMLAFEISPEDVEASMGGYITSMLGAILGTLLALTGALVVQELQEKRRGAERQKNDARVLYFDIISSLSYAKLKYLSTFKPKESLTEVETYIISKMGFSEQIYDSELLTKERRAEIISSIECLTYKEQTFMIKYISAINYFACLSDSLYISGIEERYERFISSISQEYEKQKKIIGFGVYGELNEITGSYHLSEVILLNLEGHKNDFLEYNKKSNKMSKKFKAYVDKNFPHFRDYDLNTAFEDTQNYYLVTVDGKDGYISSDEVKEGFDKLLIEYDNYLKETKESKEKYFENTSIFLFQKYKKSIEEAAITGNDSKIASNILTSYTEMDFISLSELGVNASTMTKAAEIICVSYMKFIKTGECPILYREKLKPLISDECLLSNYFDFVIAHRLFPNIREHLILMQDIYKLRNKDFTCMREYVHNIDLENDLPDRMKPLYECLIKLKKYTKL
jgi:hypothetical protein